jgi:hypothetical protein
MKYRGQLHVKSTDTFFGGVCVNVYNPELRYCFRLAAFIVNNQTHWYKPPPPLKKKEKKHSMGLISAANYFSLSSSG